jgi:LacI family transcriptional regulator
MVTLRDVANLAGVSTATVSAVINSSTYVSPKLTSKVKAAMMELNYTPNEVARSLKIKSTKTLGLIIPHISHFFTDLIKGVENTVNDEGYSLILCSNHGDILKEKETIKMLKAKRVDGLIMAAVGEGEEYLESCLGTGLPIVFVDRIPAPGQIDVVVCDNFQGAYDAVSHLIKLDHKRIGAILDRAGLYTSRERKAGFKQAFADRNLPVDPLLIREGNATVESAFEHGKKLIELENPPTAIFAVNNQSTIGLMKALSQKGLACPRDVSVVGFDDVEWADFFSPRLTTVALPSIEVGRRAAKLLIKRLTTKESFAPETVTLRTNLVVRDSCQKA